MRPIEKMLYDMRDSVVQETPDLKEEATKGFDGAIEILNSLVDHYPPFLSDDKKDFMACLLGAMAFHRELVENSLTVLRKSSLSGSPVEKEAVIHAIHMIGSWLEDLHEECLGFAKEIGALEKMIRTEPRD